MTDATQTLFEARPWIVRKAWRLWRKQVLVRFVDSRYRYILPPREWSQEEGDAAIRRGQELAEKYGW